MKATILFGMMCAFGAVTPTVMADNGTATEAAAKIDAFAVAFSGGGWGGANKARAALDSMEGVTKVLMSGNRAIITVSPDYKPTKGKIRKLFSPKGLKVEKLKKLDLSKPVEGYQLTVAGSGWATTNEKARVALEKIDGVSIALVSSRKVTLLMEREGAFDEKAVTKTLKRYKSKVNGSDKMSQLPL